LGGDSISISPTEIRENFPRPDVCVLDINLPGVTGFDLHAASSPPHQRIIMFSMNDDPVFAKRAIEAGAKGYVSKSGDPADLARAIREVGTGGGFLPSSLAQTIAFGGPMVKLTACETCG
jgi:two-component system, NarL family, invasion response regulator UvrY